MIPVILFIECPVSEDGMERFACPTADRMGRYHCIDDHVLCDGFIDCPTGEDEDRQACMFYKTVSRITFVFFGRCLTFSSFHQTARARERYLQTPTFNKLGDVSRTMSFLRISFVLENMLVNSLKLCAHFLVRREEE